MLHRKARLILAAIGLLVLVVCVPILEVAFDLATFALKSPPGVGGVELAQSKIKNGMSKDEVRSVLGAPHRDRGGRMGLLGFQIIRGQRTQGALRR